MHKGPSIISPIFFIFDAHPGSCNPSQEYSPESPGNKYSVKDKISENHTLSSSTSPPPSWACSTLCGTVICIQCVHGHSVCLIHIFFGTGLHLHLMTTLQLFGMPRYCAIWPVYYACMELCLNMAVAIAGEGEGGGGRGSSGLFIVTHLLRMKGCMLKIWLK